MTLGKDISDGTNQGANKGIDFLKGIHGIGETIRGVDDVSAASFGENAHKDHRSNDAKNEATLQRGESEMQNGERAMR